MAQAAETKRQDSPWDCERRVEPTRPTSYELTRSQEIKCMGAQPLIWVGTRRLHIFRKLRHAIQAQLARRSPAENAFLFLLPMVGLIVGLISAITAHLIAFLQHEFWGSGTNLLAAAEANPPLLRIIIPLLGGLLVGVIGWFFRVETRGGGITGIIQAVALKRGVLSLRTTLPRDLAAMMTIATGGSLGREGAMALLASAVASNLGRRFRLTSQQLRVLVCAAAAGALASVYNAPIGGALFALEIIIGNFALEVLGPVVVAAVISTLVFRSCMGNLPRFEIPRYEFVSGWELVFYLGLGLLTGLTAWLFVRALFGVQDLFEKSPLPRWLRPAVGMALLGCIGIYWPHVFGNGYEAVNLALREQMPLFLLVSLLVMKVAAVALTFGSGGAGGLFTPSMMVGALVGAVFGYGVHAAFPHISAEYGAYALVGMGGVLAGMTHAPLTAIMMVFEQTNSYQIVLPLMFVCVISHVTIRLLKGNSMEEESLRRRGIKLPSGVEEGVMQSLSVSDVLHEDVESVRGTAPFTEVVERFLKSPSNYLYVSNDADRFIGAIQLHSLKAVLHQGENLSMVIAQDLVDDTFGFVTPDMRLADTMEGFWSRQCERLPVVNNVDDRRLIGWISKRDLIGVYNQEILKKRQLLSRFSFADGDSRKDVFVELPEGFRMQSLIVPARYAGRTLRELGLRKAYNVQVLQISHRDPSSGSTTMEMPGPDSRIQAEDRLIVIGTVVDIARLMCDLETGLEIGVG